MSSLLVFNIEFRRYSQSCWYFQSGFVIYCPSKLLSGSPPPSPKVEVRNLQTVSGRNGAGVSSCVIGHILQEFNTQYLTRFGTYKIASHPKQKPKRGGGLRQINTCRKVPLQVVF
jgi:hypothetical protein